MFLTRDLSKRPCAGILYRAHWQRRATKIFVNLHGIFHRTFFRYPEILRAIFCRNLQVLPRSCSLQHCSGFLARICFLRAAPLSHVMLGPITSLTRNRRPLWSLGGCLFLGSLQVVCWWCLGGALEVSR